MARGWKPTDDEVSKANGVLEAAYRGWVSNLAESLLFDFFNEDIDADAFRERIDEQTDSGLVYTNDQWTALFASKSTDDAWDELRGMGMDESREAPVAAWAVMTFRQDVNAAIWDDGLAEPINEDMDIEERINWLIENHSSSELPIGPEGTITAYLIGTVNDVGFGWLWLYRDAEGDYEKHEFIGAGIDDNAALKVLMDAILESGGDPHSSRARDLRRKLSSVSS